MRNPASTTPGGQCQRVAPVYDGQPFGGGAHAGDTCAWRWSSGSLEDNVVPGQGRTRGNRQRSDPLLDERLTHRGAALLAKYCPGSSRDRVEAILARWRSRRSARRLQTWTMPPQANIRSACPVVHRPGDAAARGRDEQWGQFGHVHRAITVKTLGGDLKHLGCMWVGSRIRTGPAITWHAADQGLEVAVSLIVGCDGPGIAIRDAVIAADGAVETTQGDGTVEFHHNRDGVGRVIDQCKITLHCVAIEQAGRSLSGEIASGMVLTFWMP